MAASPVNVARLLLEWYNPFEAVDFAGSPEELNLRDKLRDILDEAVKLSSRNHPAEDEMIGTDAAEENEDKHGDDEDEDCSHSSEPSEEMEMDSDVDYVESEDGVRRSKITPVDLEYKRKAVEFWLNGNSKKRRTFASVRNSFRKVQCDKTLRAWAKQLQSGSRFDKLNVIREKVLASVQAAKASRTLIHDIDIQRWAEAANADVGLAGFKASTGWVRAFKKASGLCSIPVKKLLSNVHQERLAGTVQVVSLGQVEAPGNPAVE
ncbi:hypothetical protein BV898_05495 [Hypsibius exemplaris]|uniref:HTH CENPB-type domain-containing protein n=1 Tax=Hypsibius exemplaris TaxID=2072580 RepID=A0A1W0WZ14_HYPEX|nr:hypothetical protein BV898_05495 [Hypsibius exemplaris]